ncbi:hypothetical protein FRC07_008462 [Ceratobasidium sp. 392]|nr:hypothetical protein FRC07_008462 [Ceratobasidium sp. 392]
MDDLIISGSRLRGMRANMIRKRKKIEQEGGLRLQAKIAANSGSRWLHQEQLVEWP